MTFIPEDPVYVAFLRSLFLLKELFWHFYQKPVQFIFLSCPQKYCKIPSALLFSLKCSRSISLCSWWIATLTKKCWIQNGNKSSTFVNRSCIAIVTLKRKHWNHLYHPEKTLSFGEFLQSVFKRILFMSLYKRVNLSNA